jgi:hypothetical protein
MWRAGPAKNYRARVLSAILAFFVNDSSNGRLARWLALTVFYTGWLVLTVFHTGSLAVFFSTPAGAVRSFSTPAGAVEKLSTPAGAPILFCPV